MCNPVAPYQNRFDTSMNEAVVTPVCDWVSARFLSQINQMRYKRTKKYKRAMNVYQTSFGFRLPFQCLVDGTMVVQAVAHKVPLDESIARTLTADTKLYVTQCILDELMQLDKEEYGKAQYVARKKLKFRKCGHSPCLSARDCIQDMIGKSNQHRFCVATHDKLLRASLRSRPGVPLVHLKKSVMVLEPPSQATMTAVSKVEVDKMMPSASELQSLAAMGSTVAAVEQKKKRRKGPAAPNPLSCLKSKKVKQSSSGKQPQPPSTVNENDEDEDEDKSKRRKHRSRRKKAVDIINDSGDAVAENACASAATAVAEHDTVDRDVDNDENDDDNDDDDKRKRRKRKRTKHHEDNTEDS